MTSLPLALLLLACGTTSDVNTKCNSGTRETWSGLVTTPEGTVEVETTQCVTALWSFADCSEFGPDYCTAFFEPDAPAQVPYDMIGGDLVFTLSVGHTGWYRPGPFAVGDDLPTAMDTFQATRLADGYLVSTVQPITMFGYPAYTLAVSCDHPDMDPICPFSWYYRMVDLTEVTPGLYGDMTALYAQWTDVGNEAAERPVEYDAYLDMIDGATMDLTGP